MRDMSSKLKRPAGSTVSQGLSKGIPSTPIAKHRTFILTGAVAFITVTGTLIGATLKSKEQIEKKQTIRQRAEVNETDQIALLDATRSQLLAQKMQLEKKIGDLRERQRRKAESDRERERLMAEDGRGIRR